MPGCREPVCHVHHLDLVSDPVSTVEQVYGHFGLALPAAAAGRMERYVAAQPNGGYGRHDYHFEDHGLNAEAERKKFRGYMLRFGVSPESPAPVTSPALRAGLGRKADQGREADQRGERSEAG